MKRGMQQKNFAHSLKCGSGMYVPIAGIGKQRSQSLDPGRERELRKAAVLVSH